MIDIVDSKVRSRMMANIKSKNTKPELLVRKFLHAHGFRYKLHDRTLPGNPDIVLPKYKTVIFIHGCFWHRHSACVLAYNPKSNVEVWQRKFESNVKRDMAAQIQLSNAGWKILIIWECELRRDAEYHLEKLSKDIKAP